ncbi:MAG TPA: hypothetical protein PLJ13_16305 [Cyclobacteriaceae bacterium]|nr:hypothetical protein [Cyclobacteriaceae bacterium]
MKLLRPAYLSFFVLIIIIGSSCSSGKSAYERGNYYDAVITAANRLCRNPGHRKSSKTLCAAYPLALKYHDDRVTVAIASNAEFKWREVVQQYTLLQSMYDQIQRCPGSSAVISKPISYQVKLADARQKAAEESYNAGILALGMRDRTNAKKAYYLFINTNDFVPGYKDVSKRIEEALAMATIKVAVEPIPVVAKNYALDAHYFDSKLNEYLVSNQTNEFVKYYKMADAKSQRINPDHIVQLTFEEFTIGQVYVNEKESQVERDSVVVAYTIADTKGNIQSTNTEVPVIKPVAGVAVAAGTQNPVSSGEAAKTETKTIQTEKSSDVNQIKTEEKPVETKTEVSKSDNTTTANKTEEVKTEEKKPVDKAAVGVGVGVGVVATDNKDEKSDGTKTTETKPDGSGNGDKNDEKKDDASKAEEQVTICHQPPGNPAERKTLKVPQSAVKAHLAHGDVTGDCTTENIDDKKSENKGSDKKEEKSDEKITENNNKSDDKNVVGVGVAAGVGAVASDKQDEKSDGKKSDDKDSSDKKDEKSDAKTEGSEKSDKSDEKKDDASKAEEQVTICHQPPGKPSERKTLTVPQSAVKAHLAHGDVTGECKSEKKEDKSKDKGNDGDGAGMASLMSVDQGTPIMIASASNHHVWYLFNEERAVDTTKVFGKVKATVHQYKKTITSRGVLNFRIIDAKTRAVISEQRMPSETVWVSEWLTYNGDSRALTPEQVNLAKRKELPSPSNQDLFVEFSKPLFDQITNKMVEFYKNY